MKRSLLLTALLLAAPQGAIAKSMSPADLVKAAVAAEGGADALRALKSITIKAEGKHWEPEQSLVAGGEARLADEFTYSVSWDLAGGKARTDWDRVMKYPAPSHEIYSEIVTPALGFVTDEKGSRPMSGMRIATHLRELERASPTLLLKALDAPKSVSGLPDQKLGGKSYPAIALKDGPVKFTILFDPASHLPLAIRTLDDDYLRGDSKYDLLLADWQPAGGAKIARSLTYQLDGGDIGKITYKEIAANGAGLPSFEAPDAVKQAAKPPSSGTVPYQWVLRRLNIYRFIDSDALLYNPAASPEGLKLVELAPNVQQVVGGSHNVLIVAMKNHLVLFDAPINELQSRWVIDAAKAKYPGKKIKQVVLTHHHMDHTGGVRTYIAEGAEIIVPAPDKAKFEMVAKAPHTVVPDELQKHKRAAKITEIADKSVLKDATEEIRLYNIDNPHAKGMIIGHVVGANVVWVTDLWSPTRDKAKGAGNLAFAAALKQLGIAPRVIAGGHGANGPMSELEAVVAQN
jgi:glyoxylase-like metal-dependent hydrolase (beta-lactamase superfamily II)